jgi:flotillin
LAVIKLEIDQVMPAEAAKRAAEYRAKGDAAAIRERGNAVKMALAELQSAWAEAGKDALSIYLIEDIEQILATATAAVGRIKVNDVNLIDGGDGQTLAAYTAAYPAMLQTVFDAVTQTTGIDIPGALSGASSGGRGRGPLPSGLGTAPSRKVGE